MRDFAMSLASIVLATYSIAEAPEQPNMPIVSSDDLEYSDLVYEPVSVLDSTYGLRLVSMLHRLTSPPKPVVIR